MSKENMEVRGGRAYEKRGKSREEILEGGGEKRINIRSVYGRRRREERINIRRTYERRGTEEKKYQKRI